ncbi:MAG TPA: XdhC family protein [Anaerolineaceae bacterium]|nr:XdhC family protein [Anaerolineaceae bacterium]
MNIFTKLKEIEDNGQVAVLCIVTKTRCSTPRHSGSKMLVFPDGSIYGTVGGGEIESLCIKEAQALILNGQTTNLNYQLVNPDQGDPGICGGEVDIYLEVIGKRPALLIIGAGHVGQKLAFLAQWLGFSVNIVDDREEIINQSSELKNIAHFPSLENYLTNRPELDSMNLFVVLTTRSLDIDVQYLPVLMKIQPVYIGVIGSKKRWLKTSELLLKSGIVEEELKKIYSPIGLDLSSETPEEIALAILAEILVVKNGATGKNLRYFRRK